MINFSRFYLWALLPLFAAFTTVLLHMDVAKPRLTAVVHSDTAGSSIVFPENGQRQRPIHVGRNILNVTIGDWSKPFRWDPVHGLEFTATVTDLKFGCLFWKTPLVLGDLKALQHIATLSDTPDGLRIVSLKAADSPSSIDPQLLVSIPKWTSALRYLGIAILGLALSASMALLLGWFQRRVKDRTVFLISLGVIAVSAIACVWMVRIPSGYGAGWDGENYLNLCVAIAHGTPPDDMNLYYYLRVLSFPLGLIAGLIDPDISSLVQVQALNAFVYMSITIVAIVLALQNLGVTTKSIRFTLGCVVSSWWFIIAPGLYPVLSDHAAIAVASVSLLIWSSGHRSVLQLPLACVSIFMHPLLLLVPGFFFVFKDRLIVGDVQPRHTLNAWQFAAATTAGIFAFFYSSSLMLGLPESSLIDRQGVGLSPAMLEARPFSVALSALLVSAIFFFVSLLSFRCVFRLSPIHLARTAIVLLAIAGLFFAATTLIPHKAIGSPPLLNNLLIQAQGAPLKQLAAHVAYIGPIALLGFVALAHTGLGGCPTSRLLGMCLSPFLLLMCLGSETRQFIHIIPILLALIVTTFDTRIPWVPILLLHLASLAPAVSIHQAMGNVRLEDDFLCPAWQVYFGRHGPWMNTPSYVYFLAILTFSAFSVRSLFVTPPDTNAGPEDSGG